MVEENSSKIVRVCTACGKKTSYGRKEKPKDCPFCHDPYWDKPKDERELFILQDQFLESGRDKEILGRMYERFVVYGENIIKKYLKKSGKLLPAHVLTEKAESVAIKLVERYLKLPDSFVQYSFGGILDKIVKGVLFSSKTKKADQEISLEKNIEEDFTIMDNPAYFIKDPVYKRDFERSFELDAYDEYAKKSIYTISEEISDLLMSMNDRIRISQKPENSIYFLLGIKNFLDKEKKVSMEQYYDLCSIQDRQNIENAKMIFRRYLLERMKI
jgi:hypothetical protein